MAARWGKITGDQIATALRGQIDSGKKEVVIHGLTTDSRALERGQLFVALRGERYDGHDFVRKAFEKGASGAVVERGASPDIPRGTYPLVITVHDTLKALGDLASWWRHRHSSTIIAITGSAGKTSTKDMTAGILALGASTLKNEGNLNNLIGMPLTLLRLDEDHQRAVLEMGMNRPGEIGRLTEIADPHVGLITNVARAHLAGLGDMRGVARAKCELLEKMSQDSTAILNGDVPLLMEEAGRFKRAFMTFGFEKNNHIRAEAIQYMGMEGMAFKIRYKNRTLPIELRVPGIQNVSNALAASAVALSLHEPEEHLVEGLKRFRGIKGRFSITPLNMGATLIDDTYNANPSSLMAAIHTIKGWLPDGGRLIVGLGEMLELGQEAARAHREAGEMVAELKPLLFLAMGEHAREMLDGALGKGLPRETCYEVKSHEEMVRMIKETMGESDIVLLKASRGMRLEKVAEGLIHQEE
jgi:UDP-N-acetylmuramoyl-tripeptide--D-alanyl-D-alanine ligase